MRRMRGEVSKKFSFLLYVDRVHEKGNLTFSLDFFSYSCTHPIKLCTFRGCRTPKNTVGKLNHLDLWGADIRNAYLEAFTDEKLYIVAGPEFQELEGYILIFLKALYGLKSSGKRWAEVIHGILRDMNFYPQKLIHASGSGKHQI